MLINYNKIKAIVFLLLCITLISCSIEPQPIKMGDTCTACKMGVADNRFGAELITIKGKIYKFDDIHCVLEFLKANTVPKEQLKSILFVDFEAPHNFITLENANLLKSDELRSPMGSNIAVFKSLTELTNSQAKLGGEKVKWESLTDK